MRHTHSNIQYNTIPSHIIIIHFDETCCLQRNNIKCHNAPTRIHTPANTKVRNENTILDAFVRALRYNCFSGEFTTNKRYLHLHIIFFASLQPFPLLIFCFFSVSVNTEQIVEAPNRFGILAYSVRNCIVFRFKYSTEMNCGREKYTLLQRRNMNMKNSGEHWTTQPTEKGMEKSMKKTCAVLDYTRQTLNFLNIHMKMDWFMHHISKSCYSCLCHAILTQRTSNHIVISTANHHPHLSWDKILLLIFIYPFSER